jgi:hypothetical protein
VPTYIVHNPPFLNFRMGNDASRVSFGQLRTARCLFMTIEADEKRTIIFAMGFFVWRQCPLPCHSNFAPRYGSM